MFSHRHISPIEGGARSTVPSCRYAHSAGIGGSFATAALSVGSHSITASVTDSGGQNGSASINITVAAPATLPELSVHDIDYDTAGSDDRDLLVFVEVVDDTGDELSGASISIEVFRDGMLAANGTATTDEDGVATFTLASAQFGTYVTEVTNVTAEGFAWDGLTPENETSF